MFNKHFVVVFSVVVLSLLTVRPMAAADTSFGLKAGISIANFKGSPHSSSLTNLTLGGFAVFRLTDYLFLQPELNFVQKGQKTQSAYYWLPNVPIKIKIHYLEIPVLIKFNLTSESSITPSLLAGPYMAFKLHSRTQAGGVSLDWHHFKSTDFGIVLGGALDCKMGKNTLVFDLRYNLGLSKIAEDTKTKTLAATVGIRF